jgi:hypothetical protein
MLRSNEKAREGLATTDDAIRCRSSGHRRAAPRGDHAVTLIMVSAHISGNLQPWGDPSAKEHRP